MAVTLKEGDAAPAITMPLVGGGTAALADHAGRALVLYFYPKDDTPGCTKEAIGFSAAKASFDAAGIDILGVSRDSVASHAKFCAKHDLTIALGADIDGTVTEAYGVWVEKSMYGKTYMGIDRATFLIDGTGTIRRIWRKVKVPGHVEEVLAAAKAL